MVVWSIVYVFYLFDVFCFMLRLLKVFLWSPGKGLPDVRSQRDLIFLVREYWILWRPKRLTEAITHYSVKALTQKSIWSDLWLLDIDYSSAVQLITRWYLDTVSRLCSFFKISCNTVAFYCVAPKLFSLLYYPLLLP